MKSLLLAAAALLIAAPAAFAGQPVNGAAVEAILAPIISPNDTKATLGKLRAALRDAPTRFECDIPHPDSSSGAEQLLAALGAIQFRPGRHGGDGRECDPSHSVATVLQAVTIIGWVREGLVRRLGE